MDELSEKIDYAVRQYNVDYNHNLKASAETLRMFNSMNEKFSSLDKKVDVFMQKFDDFYKYMREKLDKNEIDHEKISEIQCNTSGSVKKLQLWRAGLATAITLVSMVAGYMMNDYIQFRKDQLGVHVEIKNSINSLKSSVDSLTILLKH